MQKFATEKEIVKALKAIGSGVDDFWGVCVALAGLLPGNHKPEQLKRVAEIFSPFLSSPDSRFFILPKGSLVMLLYKPSLDQLDEMCDEVKQLFQNDPLLQQSDGESFVQVFSLASQQEAFLAALKQVDAGINLDNAEVKPVLSPLSPETLADIIGRLKQMDTVDFLRRQSAVYFASDNENHVLFHEYYTSIMHLQQALCPQVDLTSDKALFNQLTEILDVKMLEGLLKLSLHNYPAAISLNLNISTLTQPIFESYLVNRPAPLIVELQLVDLFNNFETYQQMIRKLHDGGHQVCLDGITPMDLECVEIMAMHPDYVKFIWTPMWQEPHYTDLMKTTIESDTRVRFVLARCGEEEAIQWGKGLGLHIFQGRFVDLLLAAMTKNSCTFGQECSVKQCMDSKSCLCGPLRKQCVNPQHLDDNLELREYL